MLMLVKARDCLKPSIELALTLSEQQNAAD